MAFHALTASLLWLDAVNCLCHRLYGDGFWSVVDLASSAAWISLLAYVIEFQLTGGTGRQAHNPYQELLAEDCTSSVAEHTCKFVIFLVVYFSRFCFCLLAHISAMGKVALKRWFHVSTIHVGPSVRDTPAAMYLCSKDPDRILLTCFPPYILAQTDMKHSDK